MWLIFLFFAAILSTAIWYVWDKSEKYKISILSLIYWGATVMVFVDHTLGYLMYGGTYFDTSLSAYILGVVLILVGAMLWEIYLVFEDPAKKLKKLTIP